MIIRKLWYWLVPTYERLNYRMLTENQADKLIRETDHLYPEEERWRIAKENDQLLKFGLPVVRIERRRRIRS